MNQNSYSPPSQFSMFPPVIKHLLILNGLAFLAQYAGDVTGPSTLLFEAMNRWFPLYPIGQGFMPWQVITYAFLHGGLGHLFFNMFALWMFGVQLELRWGSKQFAIYYFLCVLGAALAQLVVTLGSGVPTVGASGGVFGILLAFGMTFPNQPIYMLFFPVPIKAKWFVLGYGLLELYSGVTGTSMGVAHFAHLGGMFVGIVVILYWRGKLPIKPAHRIM